MLTLKALNPRVQSEITRAGLDQTTGGEEPPGMASDFEKGSFIVRPHFIFSLIFRFAKRTLRKRRGRGSVFPRDKV